MNRSYSRRELYALGEPLGDCVTRKEGGRIIYGGGGDGGGGGAPSTQTQITELPDWAKPYAQETLAKTKALTATPYQRYEAPRIAGFSPMQEQAFQAAGQMQPSRLGQFGGRVAGAAALGALGTEYDPFQMGQFTAGRAAQYMNPFVEQAMEPQLREAQRTSQMQRMADQAQAVRAGAFGGSRQAIIEAERQRNLGTQLGDIRARGYMSAFDQAQQQFAREQQLREQSRQFGAGLGMQGLQTALQGAGQMGALGGQEFEQQRGVIGLQQQLGAQQQALRQQGLTQAYQDFLNEQNYPYRQLGFMSDMIRGLPLGQQSTRQLYEAPGSLAGQIGGIGTGLLGLSAMGRMFKEGGAVEDDADSYAEGGDVTSDYNVSDIISGLSDVQLQQARLAALNSRDQNRLEMIDNELAERASLRGGLGGAFNMLPQEQQDAVTEMAGGGIVAFADGGDVERYQAGGATDFNTAMSNYDAARARMMEARQKLNSYGLRQRQLDPEGYQAALRAVESASAALPTAQSAYERALSASGLDKPVFGRFRTGAYGAATGLPAMAAADAATRTTALEQGRAPKTGAESTTSTYTRSRAPAPADRAKEDRAPKEKPAAETAGVSQALNAMAAQTGVSRESLNDIFDRYYKSLSSKTEANMKSIADMIEKSAGRSKEVKEKAMGRALAEFGFNWAAKAAEPGARFFGSAAKASPSLAASLAESDKLAREMDQNDLKLRINAKQFETEQARGNFTGASQLAAQERMLMQSQEQLALKRQELVQQAAYQQGMLGNQRADLARRDAAARAQGISALANLQRAQNAMAESARKAALDFDGSAAARALRKQLSEKYDPEKATYLYNQKRREYVRENMQLARDQAEGGTQVPNVFDLLGQG